MNSYRETLPRDRVFEEVILSRNLVGRTLADHVYTSRGILLIKRENVLTEEMIDRLMRFGVQKVYVTKSKF